jgi:hypothetical protein
MSSISKQRWNAAHYVQVKVSVAPDIAAAFKAACASDGISMAAAISEFMDDYSERLPAKASPKSGLTTRKARRAAVKSITEKLSELLEAEEAYYDNVPENLHGSKWHQSSEISIAAIQEVIELLEEIYS